MEKKPWVKVSSALAALAVVASCASAPAAPPAAKVAPAAAAAPAPTTVGTGERIPFEGFEDGAAWVAVAGSWKDGNQSTTARIVTKNATEGAAALEASYHFVNDPAKKGASWMTEDLLKRNWDGVRAVTVDINNTTGKTLGFDLAVCTGDNWDWYETQIVTVAPGLQKGVVFDLTDVKSNVNNWAWGGKVLNPKTVQRVVIQVINGPAQGDQATLYFDNLVLVK